MLAHSLSRHTFTLYQLITWDHFCETHPQYILIFTVTLLLSSGYSSLTITHIHFIESYKQRGKSHRYTHTDCIYSICFTAIRSLARARGFNSFPSQCISLLSSHRPSKVPFLFLSSLSAWLQCCPRTCWLWLVPNHNRTLRFSFPFGYQLWHWPWCMRVSVVFVLGYESREIWI